MYGTRIGLSNQLCRIAQDGSALIKVFAKLGLGIACVPTVIESDVAKQFGLRRVGRVPELSEPLYLIRPAGHHVHPLLQEIEADAAEGAS